MSLNQRALIGESRSGGSKLTWFLPILAAAALALGFSGFMALSEDLGLFAIHGAALKTVQLFILNLGPADLTNWQTRVASVIAPLTTVGATMAAFSGRLKTWRQWASLQMNPAHDLYLGAGRTAAAIATSSRVAKKESRRNVGIDLNQSTSLEEAVIGLPGCFVLQGDAVLPATLRKINAGGAARVWVVAGDDERNISILRSLILAEGNRKVSSRGHDHELKATRRWFVDISNRDTVRLASTLFKNPKDVAIEYFNFERIAARRLMQQFAEDVLPGLCLSPETRPILHVCVVGSSELAEAIVIQSIQQLVVSERPEHCLRLTWVSPDASESMLRLTKRTPALGDIPANDQLFAGLLPLAFTNCLDLDERNISPHEWSEAQKECSFSAVYIACNDELLSAGAMFRISALRDMTSAAQETPHPIVLCHWNKPPSWTAEVRINALVHFHVSSEIFRPGESYPGEHMDELAKLINASYSLPVESGKPRDSFVEIEWAKLAEPMKWSSRLSADHSAVKDALIANLEDKGTNKRRTVDLTQDEVEQNLIFLAELEHRRFLVERLIEGWLPLATDGSHSSDGSASGLNYSKQKSLLRLNTTLVSYSHLPEAEQTKILPSIRALPKLIAWTAPSRP
jgi:hypothetical protein